MEKLVKIHCSPFDPSIEVVGNISINLFVPYSESEVTIQINPNILDYVENIDNPGIQISQLTIRSETLDTKTLRFDLKSNNTHTFHINNETYVMKLMNIGRENIQEQDFFYFEFYIKWEVLITDYSPGGAIVFNFFAEENSIHPEQCIFDIGDRENLNEKRISMIIDKDFNLKFQLIDLNGQLFEIIQDESNYWKRESWCKVTCSWNSKILKLRTSEEDGNEDFDEKIIILNNIQLFHMWEHPPIVIGCDLKDNRFTKMSLEYFKIFSSPII